MFFNSIDFLFFLPLVFLMYWKIGEKNLRLQNLFILFSSYFFYGCWDWRFLFLIGFSTVLDFGIGKQLEKSKEEATRRKYLILSLLLNLGLLGFFKYYNFFTESFSSLIRQLGFQIDEWTLSIILPVGISFYTFQTMSYTIDVYKRKIPATTDFIAFASFVSFFPQLVAGPIERASNLLPQFSKQRKFNFDQAVEGVCLICYGLFKKVVIADRLSVYVNNVFDNVDSANSISLTVATVFFSFQIYCDFSGYSLIARGTAKLLGFELMVNFNKPYLAQSIPDFWRKWHISLSTWFKDYLYIPLGGNRAGQIINYRNILIVFLVSGLWHGANWTFVIWGLLHAVYQMLYLILRGSQSRNKKSSIVGKIMNIATVYFLVCFAWIFFRADSLDSAFYYIQSILTLGFDLNPSVVFAGKGPLNFIISFAVIGLLFLSYLLPADMKFKKNSQSIIFVVASIIFITILGVNEGSEFIYFQF
jgi:alginate O-acetyltransferase complex protein AlgI